jgi:hypothetical protein
VLATRQERFIALVSLQRKSQKIARCRSRGGKTCTSCPNARPDLSGKKWLRSEKLGLLKDNDSATPHRIKQQDGLCNLAPYDSLIAG